MSKVFCGKCNFFKPGISWIIGVKSSDSECDAPENLEDTYLREKGKHIQIPCDLNKNNNCKFYEEREKKSKYRVSMSKVFCSKCDFILQTTDCLALENLEDTYLKENNQRLKKPYELNKKNNCKYYKEKEK